MKSALCVGINKYGSGSDLAGCINDLRDWSDVLRARGFAVAKLADKDATGENIRTAIGTLVAGAFPGDTLVFQYSGHGSYVPDENSDEPDGADECICPVDIFTKGPITDDDLRVLYANRPLGIKMIVISDSCHSGTVTRFMSMPTTKALVQRRVRFMPPAAFLSSTEANKLNKGFRRSLPVGRHAALLFSGCADPEYSYDAYFNGRPNGAFTFCALAALKSLPVRSSYQRWFTAIRKMLPSQEYPQTPALFGSSTMKRWNVFA